MRGAGVGDGSWWLLLCSSLAASWGVVGTVRLHRYTRTCNVTMPDSKQNLQSSFAPACAPHATLFSKYTINLHLISNKRRL